MWREIEALKNVDKLRTCVSPVEIEKALAGVRGLSLPDVDSVSSLDRRLAALKVQLPLVKALESTLSACEGADPLAKVSSLREVDARVEAAGLKDGPAKWFPELKGERLFDQAMDTLQHALEQTDKAAAEQLEKDRKASADRAEAERDALAKAAAERDAQKTEIAEGLDLIAGEASWDFNNTLKQERAALEEEMQEKFIAEQRKMEVETDRIASERAATIVSRQLADQLALAREEAEQELKHKLEELTNKLTKEFADKERNAAEKLAEEQARTSDAEKRVVEHSAARQEALQKLEQITAERAAAEHEFTLEATRQRVAAERELTQRLSAERAAAKTELAQKLVAERGDAEKEFAQRMVDWHAAAEKKFEEELLAERHKTDCAFQEKIALEREAADTEHKKAAERILSEEARAEAAENLAADRATAHQVATQKLEKLAAERLEAEKEFELKLGSERVKAEQELTQRLEAQRAAAQEKYASELAAEIGAAEVEVTKKLAGEHLAAENKLARQLEEQTIAGNKSFAEALFAKCAASETEFKDRFVAERKALEDELAAEKARAAAAKQSATDLRDIAEDRDAANQEFKAKMAAEVEALKKGFADALEQARLEAEDVYKHKYAVELKATSMRSSLLAGQGGIDQLKKAVHLYDVEQIEMLLSAVEQYGIEEQDVDVKECGVGVIADAGELLKNLQIPDKALELLAQVQEEAATPHPQMYVLWRLLHLSDHLLQLLGFECQEYGANESLQSAFAKLCGDAGLTTIFMSTNAEEIEVARRFFGRLFHCRLLKDPTSWMGTQSGAIPVRRPSGVSEAAAPSLRRCKSGSFAATSKIAGTSGRGVVVQAYDTMLSHSKEWIAETLTRAPDNCRPEEFEGALTNNFVNLTWMMGEKYAQDCQRVSCRDTILELASSKAAYRDEIYVQVMKQLTGNTSPSSLKPGWELLRALCEGAPPGENIVEFVHGFVLGARDGLKSDPDCANWAGDSIDACVDALCGTPRMTTTEKIWETTVWCLDTAQASILSAVVGSGWRLHLG